MRPAISDRVKETTTTTGLAAYALAGAPDGFRRFRDDGNFAAGRPALYLAVDNPDATTEWELGYGALTIDTVDTLARSTVLKSTNDNLPVEWAAGIKTVACISSSHIFNTIIDALDSDLVTAGTSTAYTVTTYRPDAGLYEGRFLCLFLHTANGANPELKTDDEAFKPIVDINGNPPAAGSMPPAYYWFKFRAATQKWVVFSPFNYLASNGGTMTGALNMSGAAINEAQGADIASASTLNLDAATGNLVDVTGNNTIVLVTLAQGRCRTVRFTGTPTLTHGSLHVLPGAANIVAQAGDYVTYRGYAGGVVRVESYTRANGQPVALPAASTSVAGAQRNASDTEAKAKSANNRTLTPSNVAALSYISPAGTAFNTVADTQLSENHGLGGMPLSFGAVIECQSADRGYAVGDRVKLNTDNGGGGFSLWANATAVGMSMQSTHFEASKGGNAVGALDLTKWKVFLYASLI